MRHLTVLTFVISSLLPAPPSHRRARVAVPRGSRSPACARSVRFS